ncbi:MAG: hypothetical protein B7Z29_17600 [Hyphomicrobium sp. 12-62-95]|nr:MAG: hypothetical protein B7Z29_17600 [Hyphomicrobium sp. 12-62-95]
MSPKSAQSPDQIPQLAAPPTAQGVWPSSSDALPLFLTQRELAQLLVKSVRTLERDRMAGSGIAFRKVGRTVLYAKQDVLDYLAASRFVSTAEARAERAA